MVTADLGNTGHVKLELVLSPVRARDLFHSAWCRMGFVCGLDLDTSVSATREAHATPLQESIPNKHRACSDYPAEARSKL